MKQPSNRETTNRKEMVCPMCDREGLEQNPAYIDEYKGKTDLIKATRCPNEECKYHMGIPQEEIKKQMPDNNIKIILKSVKKNPKNVLIGAIGSIFLLFAIFNFMGLGLFADSEIGSEYEYVEIEGQVISDEYNIEDLSVELYDNETNEMVNQTTTNSNGEYVFNNISAGNYYAYVISDDSIPVGPKGENIHIENGEDINYSQNGEIELVDSTVKRINQTLSSADININYKNPSNIDDFDLDISPIEGTDIERDAVINSGESENVITPVTPNTEQLSVYAPLTSEETIENNRYEGSSENFEVIGNRNAEDMDIILTNESAADMNTRTVEVTGGESTQEQISISSEETLGEVNVTLTDGTAQSQQQKTGTLDYIDNIEAIDTGVTAYTNGNLQVTPITKETNKTITGTLNNDGQIQENFDGNQNIMDAEIRFLGGDSEASITGEKNIEKSASEGSKEIVEEIAVIDESGTYNIDWEFDAIQNEELIDVWYEINGEEIESILGEDSTIMSLEEDDQINIGMDVYADTVTGAGNDFESPYSGTENDNLNIIDIEYEDDFSAVTAITVENTDTNSVTEEFELFVNGERDMSTTATIEGNSEKEINLGYRVIGDSSEGTSYIHVNNEGPFLSEPSNIERNYGSVQGNIQVSNLDSEGEVKLDTNNDNEYDCIELANNGVCELPEMEPEEQVFNYKQEGIDNTQFEIIYTQKENPQNLGIDVGNNGITDMSYDGVLESTESSTVELPPNSTELAFNSQNDGAIDYSLTWQSESTIDTPTLDIDGENKIQNEDEFQGTRSYQIGTLSQGEHTFRFNSASGGYTAIIEWSEDEEFNYPSATLNGEDACEPSDFAQNLTCSVSSDIDLSPGSNIIDFENTHTDEFNYQLVLNNTAVADEISVESESIVEDITRPNPETEPWENVQSSNLLTQGDNKLTVNSDDVDGLEPDAKSRIQYTFDSDPTTGLEITVINGMGEETDIEIPESMISDDEIISDGIITIPSSALTLGENTIRIESASGIMDVEGYLIAGDEKLSVEDN